MAQTPYGDWIEATSTQKAQQYAKNWQTAVAMASNAYTNIAPILGGTGGNQLGGACVGAYAFSVGWVWQASATWINVVNSYNYTWNPLYGGKMVGGELIEPIDTFTQLWGGPTVTNHAPTITRGILINGMTSDMNLQVQIGTVAAASVTASDADAADVLSYTWLVLPMPDAPTDHTTLAPVPFSLLSSNPTTGTITFNPPKAAGYYRLTVWVSDGNGKAATHSVPFEATVLPGATSAYCTVDAFVTDYNVAVSSAVVAPNAGNAAWLAGLWNGLPRNAVPPGSGYGLGSNQFPYVQFPVPTSFASTTPSRIVAAFFMQGGAPLNNMGTQMTTCANPSSGCTGYFLYYVPKPWSETGVTWATAPCTAGSPPLTTGVGVCTTLAGYMSSSIDTPPVATVLPFTPVGVAQPPGLQMNGNYFYFDITSHAAPLIAAGATSLSYMMLASGPTSRSTFFTSQEAMPNAQNSAYISMWPAVSATTVTATMAVSGTTAMTPTAVKTMQASVAATMPGVSASQVTVTVVGAQVTTSIALTPAQAAAFSPAAQAAWAAGLAADTGVPASSIVVSPVAAPPAGRRHLFQAGGMEVPITMVGFPPASPSAGGAPDASCTNASNALMAAVANPTSASATALSASGVPPGVSVSEPPATWHHVATAAVPPPGTDPATASALMSNNVENGGLAAEMGRRGLAADVGGPGKFLRPSAAMRSLNPFEHYRGSSGVASPPPAPGSILVTLQAGANSNSIQLLIIVAVASLFISGVAVCAAGAAFLHVNGGGAAASAAGGAYGTKSGDVESLGAASGALGACGSGERVSKSRKSRSKA